MAYVTPGTVAAGDVATAAAWNVITNDVIDLNSRVTSPAGSNVTDGSGVVLSTSATSVLSTTITCSGTRPVLVVWSCAYQEGSSGSTKTATFQLYIAGVAVGITTGALTAVYNSNFASASGSYLEIPPAGSRTYAIYGLASNASSVFARNRMLTVTEI